MKQARLDGPFCAWCTTRLKTGIDDNGEFFFEDTRGELHDVCPVLNVPTDVFMREVVVSDADLA